MRRTVLEIVGWYGAVAIIAAYILVSFDLIIADSLLYQVLNGTGAAGIVLVSVAKRSWQPAVLNTVWMAIAGVALIRLFFI